MTTTVRRATADDAGTLAEVAGATFALACPPDTKLTAIADFIATHFTRAHFDEYLADPERALFLAWVDDVAAGYSVVIFGEPDDADVVSAITTRPTSELSKLYVLPGHHGAGVSQALVAASIDEARERGAKAMWLGVNQFNQRANGFYEKSGFVKVGVKKFLVGDRWEDDFVRELAL
jgi:GNAT superfamily N-acetyltransferase